jgi:hypothetical protein
VARGGFGRDAAAAPASVPERESAEEGAVALNLAGAWAHTTDSIVSGRSVFTYGTRRELLVTDLLPQADDDDEGKSGIA